MPRGKKNDDEATPLELGDRPPSAYSLNGDIATVADELIGVHSVELGHLVNFKLAYQRRETTRVDETWDVDGVAKSWIASDRDRGLHSFDAGVWVRGTTWDRLDPMQRRALVLHHLLHFQVTPKYALKRVGHDVGEFAMVGRIYGAWETNLQLWTRALDDFAGSAEKRSPSERRMEEERGTSPAPTPIRPVADQPPLN